MSLVSAVPVVSEKRAGLPIVKGKDYDRIVIIVFENQDYSDVAKDPYFSTIADNHNGILLTNYMALTHPSQPNYVGMISGSTDGVFLDNDSNIDRESVVDLLDAKGISWKSYQQSYPGNCSTGTSYGTYRRKHNPFISFTNIAQNTTRCANIVNADELDKDIENNTVPQFVFFTPDMNNDGHDTDLTYASNWAKSFLEPRVNKPAFSDNTLFIVTWDENKTWIIKKNEVYTILFGPAVKRSSKTDDSSYSHYSILKSIEENWDLDGLGKKDADAGALVIKD
ncbi:phosphoesterase family-domain-containing protein [Syncephalastrum racemosum]|uniref:Phosphoesterase family-domain-containing protein n=1 Tax=Syncephalastrum racemosum TaxID=13706 RepID=A0A1X2HPT4_SYNRA|nr:phosphoesterase family-domain-containing protein [Syncephalastrum racemosum]